MCDATSLMAASGVATAFGQYSQGQGAKRQGEFIAGQDTYAAKVALDDAQQQAQMIRRAGSRAVGRADVNAAASGIVVGQGSSGEVDKQIYLDSEHDAYTTLLTGSRRARALQVDAVAAKAGGNTAAAQATAASIGTVLSSGYKTYRAWGGGSGGAFDLGAYARGGVGNNDRSMFSTGAATDWFQKYGRGGD